MTVRPLRVALTGGIATGKSSCLSKFASLGVPTIDADVLAREAVRPGTPALGAIVARFGPGMLQPDGQLDRTALGRLVFADAAARRDLEAIVHPPVYAAIQTWFARNDAGGRIAEGVRPGFRQTGQTPSLIRPPASFLVADVPLLYETGHAGDFDRVVVAACRPDQQLERLMARAGVSEAEARQRIATQLPIGDKARRADYVIDTSGDMTGTDRQVVEVFERLRGQAGGM